MYYLKTLDLLRILKRVDKHDGRKLEAKEKIALDVIKKYIAKIIDYDKKSATRPEVMFATSRREHTKRDASHIAQALYVELKKQFIMEMEEDSFISRINRFKNCLLIDRGSKRYGGKQIAWNF